MSLFARRRPDEVEPASTFSPDAAMQSLLQALPFEWLIVDTRFRVVASSPSAVAFGLEKAGVLSDRLMRAHVTTAMRNGAVSEVDLDAGGNGSGLPARALRLRVCRIDAAHACILIEDVTHPLRVDAMRRDFVVNVSHELKTPVGALVLLTEAARSATDEPEVLGRFLDRMQHEAQRLSTLINDLSDLSKLQSDDISLNLRHIPVQRLIAEALDTSRLLAQSRRIDVVTSCPPDLSVDGDEAQLVTALRNLVTNAITYSPPFTKVSVTAAKKGDYVEIAVRDQGIGIPEAEIERIFERFYRVDPARSRETGGTGLGLAIVKHICSSHGGECQVWSQVDEGSTFTLRLPARQAAATD